MEKYNSVYYSIYENLKNIGNFKTYLIDNFATAVFFHFPHGYSKTASYVEVYKHGKLHRTRKFHIIPGNNNIIKLVYYYFVFQYILFRYVPLGSYVIVDNPVLCIFNFASSLLKHVRYIYWIGDYYPENTGFMKIYNSLSNYYNKSLKIVWYVSPPVMKMYNKNNNAHNSKKIRMLVSLGVLRKISSDKKKHLNKTVTLGFIGVIREQQGLDLVFSYLQKFKNAKLEVIGSGYKLEYYKNMAKRMKIQKKVKFYGYVENMDKIAKKWDIGIALYENTKSNVSIYCEPTKIKNYLEYDLPVITTKSTYFYKELEREKAGLAISETTNDLDKGIKTIIRNYKIYKKGVGFLLSKYEYNKYYDSLLKPMGKSF